MLTGDDGCVLRDPVAAGLRIAKRRHQLGWRQEDLAARLGVSPSTVANWERGKSFPTRKLGAIEQVLGIVILTEDGHLADPNEQAIADMDWLDDDERAQLVYAYRERRRLRAERPPRAS